jgi:NH3-dependent NAD+ synthetase
VVSDGIDPCGSFTASVKALGPEKVKALILTECDITTKTDVEDVMLLCESLRVTCERVEITRILHMMRENIPDFDPGDHSPT